MRYKRGMNPNSRNGFKKGKENLMYGKGSPVPFIKDHIPWNKGKIGQYKRKVTEEEFLNKKRGENHYHWLGDTVGYSGVHSWITKTLGKPQKCDRCKTNRATRFEWDNISGDYKRDIEDWERLCSKCHANKHKNWEKRWGATPI